MQDEDYIKIIIQDKVKGPSQWCQFLQQLKALFLKLPKIGKSKKNNDLRKINQPYKFVKNGMVINNNL